MSEKMWVPIARVLAQGHLGVDLTSTEKTLIEANAEAWEGNSQQVPDVDVEENGYDGRRKMTYRVLDRVGYLIWASVMEGGQAFIPVRLLVKPKAKVADSVKRKMSYATGDAFSIPDWSNQ